MYTYMYTYIHTPIRTHSYRTCAVINDVPLRTHSYRTCAVINDVPRGRILSAPFWSTLFSQWMKNPGSEYHRVEVL